MRKLICVLLCISIFLSGCAGRNANPVPAYLPGDENRSCKGLKAEIAQLEADMARILPETNKFGYNTLCFVGGLLVIVPFFLMDLKDAEKVEWEAMRVRRNRLVVYAAEKSCDFGGKEPVPIPSLEEIKKMSEEANKSKNSKTITEDEPINRKNTNRTNEKTYIEKGLEKSAFTNNKYKQKAVEYNKSGVELRQIGELDLALEEFNKAIEIDPMMAQAYINRAMVYYLNEEYEKSWIDIQMAQNLGIEPNQKLVNALKLRLNIEDSNI